jgi:hypothetical protein
MTMLILAAGLNRQFRFVSIVTILQQAAAAPVETKRHGAPRALPMQKGRGERRLTACQRVGQTLALFRYYTEV